MTGDPSTKEALSPQLKILSYNIHKGFSFTQKFVLDSIKYAVHKTEADLVFLQEIVGQNHLHLKNVSGWPEVGQFQFLADNVWDHFAYGKNAIYSHGHHGNAILSQSQIIEWENIDISNNRLERRGMLHATIANRFDPSRPLHAICVHLDLFEGGRKQQLKKIAARIRSHVPDDCSLIVAGDFNDWREIATPFFADELGVHEAFRSLHGHHATSFPAWFPFLKLDRIYLRGFESVEAKCLTHPPWSSLSDHGAILATIRPSP
jgi:endonuclease/exonuclease/phosphatase family metal-dependent hydrolase